MLDVVATDLVSIIDYISDQLILGDQLPPEDKGALMRALLMKHT